MGAGGTCNAEFDEKSVKNFGGLKNIRTFAIPLDVNERDFLRSSLKRLKEVQASTENLIRIESVDFFEKRQDRLEL